VDRAKSEKLAPFRMLAQLDQRNTCLRRIRHQLRVRPVHRSESEGQNDNGKERATSWEDPNDPQHPMCITESGQPPKQGQTLIAKDLFQLFLSCFTRCGECPQRTFAFDSRPRYRRTNSCAKTFNADYLFFPDGVDWLFHGVPR